MFNKILIANRGEIALRILRACRTLGVGAVVAYSEADRDSLAPQLADEAICIGPADARRSYLSAPAVISAAVVTGCDAIHPGYGFLAEDAGFADVVRAHGLRTIPGSGMLRDEAHALEEAERIGFPVLIKPSAGGGGKGMRLIKTPRDLETSFKVSRSEAKAGFGDDSLYLEKYLDDNRHVEIQVAVDHFGHAIHMGERDCSVQRRHQKMIEETPSPALTEAARQELCSRAVRAVVEAGYENLGTLEFLIDAKGDAYFIEINCRIQVEHPITEMCTGIDMVAMQIKIAAGEPLGMTQADVVSTGHAIEFRILAEDPSHDFRPQSGQVLGYLAPGGPGVRMDTHIYPGYEVPSYYDSLLGKLSVWAPDRAGAIARGDAALRELLVDGLTTNIDLHRAILANEVFIDGKVTTSLLDRVGSDPFVAAGNR